MSTYFAIVDESGVVQRVVVGGSKERLSVVLGVSTDRIIETKPDDESEAFAAPGLGFDAAEVSKFAEPWTQPQGAHDAYPKGVRVFHNGVIWTSLINANVWAPGVSGWREREVEWPQWVQPTGAHDAYAIGDKITFNGNRYRSLISANVWSPTGYPAGWQAQ